LVKSSAKSFSHLYVTPPSLRKAAIFPSRFWFFLSLVGSDDDTVFEDEVKAAAENIRAGKFSGFRHQRLYITICMKK